MNSTLNLAAFALGAVVIAGCAVGPNYQRPSVSVPTSYKATELGTWKASSPQDQMAKGNWWEMFGDATLNDREQQETANNQDLKAARSRVPQARATQLGAKPEFVPNLLADPA